MAALCLHSAAQPCGRVVRLTCIVLVAVTSVLNGCDDSASPPHQADSIYLGHTLAGDSLETADFQGKVLLLCFWATWSGPSTYGFQDLDSLWADLDSNQVALVAIALDTVEGALETYLQGQSHEFHITKDIGSAALSFEIRGIPTYVVLDAYGYQRQRVLGYKPIETIEAAVASVIRP